MKTIVKNIRDCYYHIPYTWKHYLAFLQIEKKLLGRYKYKFHDWDKLILYIFFPYLGKKTINRIHQKYQAHHPTCYMKIGGELIRCYKDQTSIDWVEAVIDWECARMTKPDKPLNARNTMEKYYPEYKKCVEPVLKKLGL